ncbi:YciI family protein [Micromonospora sp. NPDC047707]|uniref:YciI family protein n=1 Tax=Micromonospora sp. NPDC047707 TaxID=3154498 RepID=UPI0034546476
MVVLELTFTDDERRLAARPAHRERLAQLHAAGHLTAAGPWLDDSGALLVFRGDEAAVREIMATDPYYTTPGVTVASLRPWRPVVGAD